jgi:hypothetical protein
MTPDAANAANRGPTGTSGDQELADETVQPWQSDGRQRDDEERGRQARHDLFEPAELADETRMPAVRQHADHEEQPARADAVRQHLIDGALHALHVHGADAQHDEAQVAHRRIGHQLLHVGLDHRDERAVDDSDDGQQRDPGREGRGRLRKQRKRKPQQAVCPS